MEAMRVRWCESRAFWGPDKKHLKKSRKLIEFVMRRLMSS